MSTMTAALPAAVPGFGNALSGAGPVLLPAVVAAPHIARSIHQRRRPPVIPAPREASR